ncbi:enoyl-CoA hydratase/isomerase family protein [Rhizobium sp. FKY42]|uniref:enoyl-CoA hydratase/isomerase family protein n=1 Tax=Rhizobium sp. FKY42 TaxID=2562310 RepID=UPI0010C06266|nr:enoyl-CoA hydratase/isomerase family protein [Rhizobium sp. FKY42]
MTFKTLSLREQGAVLHVTINNPPLNLMTGQLAMELFQLHGLLMMRRSEIVCVVIDSADPDFFLGHFEVNELEAALDDPSKQSQYPDVNLIQGLAISWRDLPQVVIAKVRGRCRGGGLEWLLGLHMRFASENALFGFPEADGGFIPAGGGTTNTIQIAGTARAMEILLSGRDFTAAEFERYGLINRALPDSELDAYVEALAANLARRTPQVLAMHRAVQVKAVSPQEEPLFAAMAQENIAFRSAIADGSLKASIARMKTQGQTRESELDLPASLARA